jgi:hypothetical protein
MVTNGTWAWWSADLMQRKASLCRDDVRQDMRVKPLFCARHDSLADHNGMWQSKVSDEDRDSIEAHVHGGPSNTHKTAQARSRGMPTCKSTPAGLTAASRSSPGHVLENRDLVKPARRVFRCRSILIRVSPSCVVRVASSIFPSPSFSGLHYSDLAFFSIACVPLLRGCDCQCTGKSP